MDVRRRIVLFGGQGSRSLFSPASLSVIEEDVATSPAVSILLSKCHVAFLEEISNLSEEEKRILGLDLHQFGHARSLLSVEGEDQEHAVLQATTLSLHQLLHYLGEAESHSTTFDVYFNNILETTGFCAGLVPAAVVASSRTIGQYITFGVEAFRLAFWIGYRTLVRSLTFSGKQSLDATWSLIISGLYQAKVEDTISGVHAHVRRHRCPIESMLICGRVLVRHFIFPVFPIRTSFRSQGLHMISQSSKICLGRKPPLRTFTLGIMAATNWKRLSRKSKRTSMTVIYIFHRLPIS